ncbi:MAG: hypothetical protein ACI9KE_000044 [Polyangiales bacterium]
MSRERRITPGIRAFMESLGDESWLDEPLFAINWFRAKRPRAYELYGALAAWSVFRTGGKLLFKGAVTETLKGDSGGRDTLLIVNYPSATSFLDLLSGRFFQLVSPLRMMAVRRFSFVMQRRSDGPALLEHRRPRFDSAKHFAACIGPAEMPLQSFEGVETIYKGCAAVEVVMEGRKGKKALPHVTGSLRIVQADRRDAIRAWADMQDGATCVVSLERKL